MKFQRTRKRGDKLMWHERIGGGGGGKEKKKKKKNEKKRMGHREYIATLFSTHLVSLKRFR